MSDLKPIVKSEAETEIPNFEVFAKKCCDSCTANDAYCPSYCNELSKASKMPFEKILQAYERNDGDLVKICRYIKNYRVR